MPLSVSAYKLVPAWLQELYKLVKINGDPFRAQSLTENGRISLNIISFPFLRDLNDNVVVVS